MDQCVLLNPDYTFLNVVNWNRAMCLIEETSARTDRSNGEFQFRTALGGLQSRTVELNARSAADVIPTDLA